MGEVKLWICKDCGQEVISEDYPMRIPWSDGHVCFFVISEEEIEKAVERQKK